MKIPLSRFQIIFFLTIGLCSLLTPQCLGEEIKYTTTEDILYRSGKLTDYLRERCRVDVYHPKNKKDFSTVVWFHGGGLKAGKRSVPKALQGKGIAVVAVNYRLHPTVKAPAYIEDAAAAVAWTF